MEGKPNQWRASSISGMNTSWLLVFDEFGLNPPELSTVLLESLLGVLDEGDFLCSLSALLNKERMKNILLCGKKRTMHR